MAPQPPARPYQVLRARAVPRDIEDLVVCRRAMWNDIVPTGRAALDRADVEYRRWVRRKMVQGEFLGFLVRDAQGRLAGGGGLWLQPTQPRPSVVTSARPYIMSMYTSPEFRRRGVASSIVQEMIRYARSRGYPRIALHASPQGRKVYARLGFERSWEMHLALGPPYPSGWKGRAGPSSAAGGRGPSPRRPSRPRAR